MSKLVKKYKKFKQACQERGVSEQQNTGLLFAEALSLRLILRIPQAEYMWDEYYRYRTPVRQIFNEYYSLIETDRTKAGVVLDFLLSRLVLDMRVDEYFRNEYYDLRWNARRTFLNQRDKQKMTRLCISEKDKPSVDDKEKFNSNFRAFLKRDWIDLESCGREELLGFAQAHPQCFYKLSDGLQGIKARKVDFEAEPPERFFEENGGKRAILEELIRQHPALAALNASTVNTLRVLTFVRADGSVQVMGAALRMGRAGQEADNFHMHGIAANVDLETGIINSLGVDAKGCRYTLHPDSKQPIPGFRVPHWDLVLAEVKKAAEMFPAVRFVGWDIAVREKDICFVEGNSNACPDVLEMPLRRGFWKKLAPLVREVEKM